jgi:hypothetical protein
MKFRLLGVVFLLGGIAAGWFWGLEPLREAQAHVPVVKYRMDTFMAVPLGIFIGLLLIGGGERVWAIVHGTPDNAKDWAYRIALVAVTLGVAWLCWTWFDGQMSALGYGPAT